MSDPAPDAPASPAVHSDTLWGGPRWVHHATRKPVWVETKQQYWDLLNQHGFTMLDQQESRTGPERDPVSVVEAPDPMPQPFTAREAQLFHAHDAVLRKYGLIETIGCDVCFGKNRGSGCRTKLTDTSVRVECRCGIRQYQAPAGTTDLSTSLPGLAWTMNDRTGGTVVDVHGQPTSLPVDLLPPLEAEIIRAYVLMMHSRRLQRSLFCRHCVRSAGGRLMEESAMEAIVNAERVAFACRCRMLYAE